MLQINFTGNNEIYAANEFMQWVVISRHPKLVLIAVIFFQILLPWATRRIQLAYI
jgi:hypothetical protein